MICWTAAERVAWRPPEDITPSEWPEKYRTLPRGQSPRPGPWRNANAPYLAFIMDACDKAGVVQINVVKGSQGGISEAARNVIGYFAHRDPEPIGLALPDQTKGRKIVRNRLIPFFRETPVLRGLSTGVSADSQAEQIRLNNGFLLHLMWAGSATAMASDPMRIQINDEVDKFPEWTGRDVSPISAGQKRLRAYGDRGLQINISTPTTRYGYIWTLFEESTVQLYYMIPCPHCGEFQRITFPALKWDKGEFGHKKDLAAHLLKRARTTVWAECLYCAGRIEERHRQKITEAGRWMQVDRAPIRDAYGVEHPCAEDVIAWPPGTRLGLHLPAFAYLWQSWAGIAAEFLLAEGDLRKTYDWRTETCGEPFEEHLHHVTPNHFAARSRASKLGRGIVPAWAVKTTCTADTQHDHFWAVIRAWGPEMRSHRVWHGRLETFDDLDRLIFQTPFANEDPTLPPMIPELTLIDSGGTRLEDEAASRTMEVYRWALKRRSRVRAIKGANRQSRNGLFVWPGVGWLNPGPQGRREGEKKIKLQIWWLDTHHFADELAHQIGIGDEDPAAWQWTLDCEIDEVYDKHLSNAVKIPVRDRGRIVERWVPKASGARLDMWDCEVYQIAAAYMANVHLLPSAAELDLYRQEERAKQQRAKTQRAGSSGKGTAWTPTKFTV